MTSQTPIRNWNRWTGFARFLFSPLSAAGGRSTWLGALVACAIFSASVPVTHIHPLAGHLLFVGQILAILILAARHGWEGAVGGFILSTVGYLSAFSASALSATGPGATLSEFPMVVGIGVMLTLACGWFGERTREQRRLVGQLAHAEGRLGALINAMPSGLLVLDRAGGIHFSNAMARRLLAADTPEEFGLTLPSLVAPESWPALEAGLLAPAPGVIVRVTIPREVPLRTEWTFARYLDEGTLRILAFFWDAEAKCRQEEDTQAVSAALRSLQEGVILANLDGTIRYANPAAAQIYGFAELDEMVGTSLREHVAPCDLDNFEARMERARTVGGDCEIHLLRPDGGETEVHVTTSPVKNEGALIGTVGVIRDLTEAKVLARRAVQADKQATLGRLVAGAAHEINNPLAAIMTGAELLREAVAHDAEHAALLDTVMTECGRAGRIVHDLLSFARQRPGSRTKIDLAQVVKKAVALREGYTRAAGIDLTLHTPSIAPVEVDVDQIKQVVLNLLVNAEDAVVNTNDRRITVTIGRRGGRALLLVNDSGTGVPDEIQHQIFEPFFTTKPEGHGTGLGLAVSSGIVGEHGGRIGVSRGVLGGAQFSVDLPLAVAAHQTGAVPATGVSYANVAPLRILVVDDEPAILSSVGRILRRLGHEVRTAATGGDALGIALTEQFDVIMSDLRMPGMSGRELHARLTEEGVLPATDFIVATGDIADPEAHEFLQATGLPVLLKPFEIRNLVEIIGKTRANGPQGLLCVARAS